MPKSDKQINSAVKDCLSRCMLGKTPLGVIAEFIGELRAKGWNKADIKKVEVAVRKVLAGVMSDNPESDQQTDED